MKKIRSLERQIAQLKKWQLALWALACVAFIDLFIFAAVMGGGGYSLQFPVLADAFLHGQVAIRPELLHYVTGFVNGKPLLLDIVTYQGQYYWPLGPFPAVLYIPLVAVFGPAVSGGSLVVALLLIDCVTAVSIARHLGLRLPHAILLMVSLVFGSAYLGVVTNGTAWYFAQTVAFTLLLVGVWAYVARPRYHELIIGLCIAAAFATRSHLLLAVLFFGLLFWWERTSWKQFLRRSAVLCLPIFFTGLLLLWYNAARFGSPLETGYALAEVSPPFVSALQRGLLDVAHLPGNLYTLVFLAPDPVVAPGEHYTLQYPYIVPNVWGMGIIFTSPVFLYLFAARWSDPRIKAALATSAIILFPLILYYAPGAQQYGFRYAADVYPFLFFALCTVFAKSFPRRAMLLIGASLAFNLFLFSNMTYLPLDQFVVTGL